MSGRRLDDAATAGLLVGVPVVLSSVAGVPTVNLSLTGPNLVAMAVLGAWAAWAWCVIGVVVDTVRMVRAADVTLGRRAGALTRLAARIAGLVIAITSISATLPVAAAPPSAAETRAQVAAATGPSASGAPSTPSDPAVVAGPSTWTVAPGDCLWTIAERIEGDGDAWTVLADANLGQVMADGRIFTDPSLIYPGWVLQVPSAMGSAAAPSAEAPVWDPPTAADPTPPVPVGTSEPLAEVPLSPPETGARHASTAGSASPSFGDAAIVASSVLGVGAVTLGLLRRRRRRVDRHALSDEDLLDAEVLLEQSAALPGLSLTEAALLLAADDGVLTDPGLLCVGSDGARLYLGGIQVWHAEPSDLLGAAATLAPPPAALAPLGDREGSSWSLVVPAGSTGAIGGRAAAEMVDLALDLQGEMTWGHQIHAVASQADIEALDQLRDGLLITDDPELVGGRLAGIAAQEDGCLVRVDDHGVDLLEVGLRIVTPGPSPVVSDLVEDPAPIQPRHGDRPATPSTSDNPPRQSDVGPMVRLLSTTPRIDGLAQLIEPKRARRAIEVVAYIALHDPDPVTGDRIRTRVLGSSSQDAAAKTLFNVTSAARRGLGLAEDGEPVLPIADRSGCYRLGNVLTSDVAELHAHLACARRGRDVDAQMAHLRAALELVEGEPLAATLSGWDWFTVEGHRARLETAIEDAAVWLVDLALDAGLVDLAQLALDRARPAVALSEPLASRAMELAAARGSMVDLKRSFAELGAVIDELDPGCWPVLAHEERYRQLAERLRSNPDQASFAAMEAAPRSTSPSAPAAL